LSSFPARAGYEQKPDAREQFKKHGGKVTTAW
jgi:hypothetical protein